MDSPDSAGKRLARFVSDLEALLDSSERLGVAVSGGPDSIALLLLAAAARPGCVEAATVDHALRAESRAEAEMVGDLCAPSGIPHTILTIAWGAPPSANLQARARAERYAALADWAEQRGIAAVATGHHRDDQAETLLMRVARGSGVGGLAAIQPTLSLDGRSVRLIRPLLSWRRAELLAIVAEAGITPVDDPTNRDPRFDRSRARALLAATDWLDPERLAAVAAHAGDAEQALAWAAREALERRCSTNGDMLTIDPSGLPREIKRRMLLAAIERASGETPSGPSIILALDRLENGATVTLAGLKLIGGAVWRLSPAPPRTPRDQGTRIPSTLPTGE